MRIDLLKQYIQEEPNDPFNRYALALEYIKTNNKKEALDLFDHVYKYHKDYLANYYHFGLLLIELSELPKAELIISQGIIIAKNQQNNRTSSELKALLDEISD